VAENSSTKTRQAKKKEKKNSRCERQWIVYIDPVSSSYRKRVFLVRMRESSFSLSAGLDAHHPMWWWWLVPLSSAQGWLDAYFVNIRTCEVKRNIQKGTNKPKRKKNNLWT
jgi:hypothetical protein